MSAPAGSTNGAAAPRGRAAAPKDGPAQGRGAAALDRFHEESKLGESYDARMLFRLWPFVRPHRTALLTSLLLLMPRRRLRCRGLC